MLCIQLRFPPAYSPDLMPVERLWSWLSQYRCTAPGRRSCSEASAPPRRSKRRQ